MRPVNIFADNMTVLFPRSKKYNSSVNWTDLVIYFRYKGKILKRCPTIITKTKLLSDYQDLLDLFDKQEWTEEEKEYETDWSLCQFKNAKALKKYKKPIIRHLYDNPESDEVHEDIFINADKDEYGHKPFLTEVIMPQDDLTIDVLKIAAKIFLENCFNIKIKIQDINFIKNISEDEIEKNWKIYRKEKDQDQYDKKIGKKKRIVFLEEAARNLFGDDVKSVIIEGNKTTITYMTGEVIVDIKPNLKFVKKKRKNKRSKT